MCGPCLLSPRSQASLSSGNRTPIAHGSTFRGRACNKTKTKIATDQGGDGTSDWNARFRTGRFRENRAVAVASCYSNTILVVEDEPLIRMMVAEALRNAGLDVLEASSADEALSILEGGAAVDLVFADVRMPGAMDGIGLMKVLRKNRPNLKLAVASGYSPNWPSLNLVDEFIGKPYDVERAVDRIKALLGRGESA